MIITYNGDTNKHYTLDGKELNPNDLSEKTIWKVKGRGNPVIEILESFNGDLYFIIEKLGHGEVFCYARLYHMAEFAEWGYNNIRILKEAYGENKIWRVPKENWCNINTYEKNLLMEA